VEPKRKGKVEAGWPDCLEGGKKTSGNNHWGAPKRRNRAYEGKKTKNSGVLTPAKRKNLEKEKKEFLHYHKKKD